MVRKVFSTTETTVVDNTVDNSSDNLLTTYVSKKQELDLLTKQVKELGEKVKQAMETQDVKFLTCGGYKVNKITSNRVNWDTVKLLEKVKTYDIPELIEHVEQVCMPKLEELVANNEIAINDLDDCQTTTCVVSLRVTKAKE